MLDGDVVFEGVSPGFEYVIAVQCGCRHKLEFDPLATLLESWKTLPLLHPPAPIRPENTKGATGGPRLFSLYIQNSKLTGVKWTKSGLYIWNGFIWLSGIVWFWPIDKILAIGRFGAVLAFRLGRTRWTNPRPSRAWTGRPQGTLAAPTATV